MDVCEIGERAHYFELFRCLDPIMARSPALPCQVSMARGLHNKTSVKLNEEIMTDKDNNYVQDENNIVDDQDIDFCSLSSSTSSSSSSSSSFFLSFFFLLLFFFLCFSLSVFLSFFLSFFLSSSSFSSFSSSSSSSSSSFRFVFCSTVLLCKIKVIERGNEERKRHFFKELLPSLLSLLLSIILSHFTDGCYRNNCKRS